MPLFAIDKYAGNDTDGPWTVTFPYLSKTHVRVFIDGSEDVTFTWPSDTTITTTNAVAGGTNLLIRRETSRATRLVDYADGGSLTEAVLDEDSKHAFYLAQEALDEANEALGSGATSAVRGTVEIALQSEVNAGTDGDGDSGPLVVAPAELFAMLATETQRGILELATQSETNTGTNDTWAITPLKLTEFFTQLVLFAAKRLKAYTVTRKSVTISSGAVTFDFNDGNAFLCNLTENITSITLANPPTSGVHGEILIEFIQDNTGNRTVGGWPASVKWPKPIGSDNGIPPVITITPTTGADDIVLRTSNGGIKWRGNFSQDHV